MYSTGRKEPDKIGQVAQFRGQNMWEGSAWVSSRAEFIPGIVSEAQRRVPDSHGSSDANHEIGPNRPA